VWDTYSCDLVYPVGTDYSTLYDAVLNPNAFVGESSQLGGLMHLASENSHYHSFESNQDGRFRLTSNTHPIVFTLDTLTVSFDDARLSDFPDIQIPILSEDVLINPLLGQTVSTSDTVNWISDSEDIFETNLTLGFEWIGTNEFGNLESRQMYCELHDDGQFTFPAELKEHIDNSPELKLIFVGKNARKQINIGHNAFHISSSVFSPNHTD